LEERPGGVERVAADAEHHCVASAQHAGRVGDDVRTALEDEAHHSQLGTHEIDMKARVLDALYYFPAHGRGVAPTFEAIHHLRAHLLRSDQACRRTAESASAFDVFLVHGGDLVPHGV